MERIQFLASKGFEILKSAEGIIAGLVFLFTLLISMWKRIPKKVLHQYRKNNQLEGLKKGSEINNIMSKLKSSGAIYITIIRYHNGGPYKMSVEWEVLGDPCMKCAHQCKNYGNLKPLQKDWQGIKVNNVWAKITSETIMSDGRMNTKRIEWFDSDQVVKDCNSTDIEFNKKIWDLYGISSFKEMLLTHKSGKESYTLGLSFCARFRDYEEADLQMEMARRKLRHLI
jgi:hypothetical protein